MIDRLRSWWWTRQGLDGSLDGASPADVLARTGWVRSVGGAAPYLALKARAGTTRQQVDAAVASQAIHELPSARGCTYVLPAGDYALGLSLAQDEPAVATARKYLGVTEAELDQLCDAVLAAIATAPLDPRQLRDALGDAVRNLGAEGKKRGQTTTLPLALGRLQSQGRIRRIPLDGRLDRQRYAYAPWNVHPKGSTVDIARRYFRWAGPATLAQFTAFAGVSVKESKAAAAELGLVPVAGRLLLPEDLALFEAHAPSPVPRYHFLSSLDGLLLFHRDLAEVLDDPEPVRRAQKVAGGTLTDLENQPIVDRGRIVGLWDYDGVGEKVVWHSFRPADDALRKAAVEIETWIRADLGDVRSFSLDSPESRGPRLDALRALA